MSARKPFFPQAPTRPASRAEFAPDPGNPLHARNNVGSMGGATSLPSNAATNGRSGGTSFGGFLKKTSSATDNGSMANASGHNVVRPGTADPQSKNSQLRVATHQEAGQPPLIAPTPQKADHAKSALLSRPSSVSFSSSTNSFKVPFSADSLTLSEKTGVKHAHISTSNTTSSFIVPADPPPSNIKFRPLSRQSGPQRVSIEESTQYGPYRQDETTSHFNGHEVTENGRVRASSLRQFNKRTRGEIDDDGDEEYTYEKPSKRFKSHADPNELDNGSQIRDCSPMSTERPSSALTRSVQDHARHSSEVHESTLPVHNSGLERPRSPSSSPENEKSYQVYDARSQISSEPRLFEKVLGLDPDIYVKDHLDAYDQMVNKWTNCTVDQWIAGADEIAADYRKMLDSVTAYVDAKLKLYTKFRDSTRSHNIVLDQRKTVLDAASKRLVNQSGSVLK